MADKHYIFDLDNTLVPRGEPLHADFVDFFTDFCLVNRVSIVTGSDYYTVQKQLNADILRSISLFTCGGNVYHESNKLQYANQFKADIEILDWLVFTAKNSKFTTYSNKGYIQFREGSINFSIVSRDSSLYTLASYEQWDDLVQERLHLVALFNAEFTDYRACIGGKYGIDIYHVGADKSQILKHISLDDTLFFFGDATQEGGNDYELANAIERKRLGLVYTVDSWRKTHEILCYLK